MNNFIELVALLEKRPALYLSRNTISALKAFLDGWLFRSPDDVINIEIMDVFQKHIEDIFDIKGHSWDKIILLYSQDERDALDNFFIQFNEVKKKYSKLN